MLAAKLWQIAGPGSEEGLQRMMTLEMAIDKEVATMKKMRKRQDSHSYLLGFCCTTSLRACLEKTCP